MIKGIRFYMLPMWTLVAFALVFALPEIVIRLGVATFFKGIAHEMIMEVAVPWEIGMLFLAAVSYGAARMLVFNPFLKPDYLKSLQNMPWTSGKPLPNGSPHLMWQDLVVVSSLSLLTARADNSVWTLIPLVFIWSYTACLCGASFVTDLRGWSYLILFSLGLPVLALQNPTTHLVWALMLAAVSHFGLRRCLAEVGKDADLTARYAERLKSVVGQLGRTNNPIVKTGGSQGHITWPVSRLPEDSAQNISYTDKMALPILFAWLAFLAYWNSTRFWESSPADSVSGVFLLGAYIVVYSAGFRLIRYVVGYMPPLSLLGRLKSGRLIIPGYDKIVLAPACAVVAYFLISHLIVESPIVPSLWVPIAILVSMCILSFGGPDRDDWRLTGDHRMVPGIKKSEYAKPI